MKGYPLQDLLRIRRIKIDEAQAEVQRLTLIREDARLLVRKCRDELAEYTVWRLDQEQRLFEKIKKKQSWLEYLNSTGKRLVDSGSRKLA